MYMKIDCFNEEPSNKQLSACKCNLITKRGNDVDVFLKTVKSECCLVAFFHCDLKGDGKKQKGHVDSNIILMAHFQHI